jgi:hypothetical protein
LLLEIKSAVERAREVGSKHLADEEQAALSCRYDELVKRGLESKTAMNEQTVREEKAEASNVLPVNSRYESLLLRVYSFSEFKPDCRQRKCRLRRIAAT